MTAEPRPAAAPLGLGVRRGLAPVVIVWLRPGRLAGVRCSTPGPSWSEQADEATVREWLDEARIFRKTLPELVREYVRLREDDPTGPTPTGCATSADEIAEHMRGAGRADPRRT